MCNRQVQISNPSELGDKNKDPIKCPVLMELIHLKPRCFKTTNTTELSIHSIDEQTKQSNNFGIYKGTRMYKRSSFAVSIKDNIVLLP